MQDLRRSSSSAFIRIFPTLFSPGGFGNDIVLIVKGKEDSFEGESGRRDGTNFDAPPFLDILHSPDTPMPNSASSRSAPTIRHHRIDRQSGRIRKPTQARTRPKGAILQVEQGKEAMPKVVFRAGINKSLPYNLLGVLTLTTMCFANTKKSKEALRRTRDCDIIPTNPHISLSDFSI